MNLYIITILVVLAQLSHSDLSVYNQAALGVNDPKLTNVSYSMANFGFVP